LNGVHSAISGYSGGAVNNPTYRQVCAGTTGHAEAVQITFDPAVISFPELLEVFWRTHDPTTPNRQGNDVGPQYRSVIFYHTSEQKALAEQSKRELDALGAFARPIVTEIVSYDAFYPAEAYHQNYYVENPGQPYCAGVIRPKLAKFLTAFSDKLRTPRGGEGANARAGDARDSEAPFAVVELFTSEGCSSCPPADALLREILQDARKRGRRVFGLAFHVDYWDRLGWTDPYGAPAFARRQQAYARSLKIDRVYTPQMIVNGVEEFVGSDAPRSRAAIEAALKRPAGALVKLRHQEVKGTRSLAFAYAVTRAPPGAVLHVAVVERGLSSAIKRGENGGRTLRHENVVRAFRTVRLDESGQGGVELQPPAGLVPTNASVIAYVQEADSGAIAGATALALAPDAPR
jgi:methionine-S-sulfoxide reductase